MSDTIEHHAEVAGSPAMPFKWTPQKERASVLLAEDELTDKQIAEEIGVHVRTLAAWKERTEFAGVVADHAGVIRASALKFAIAKRYRRVAYLQRMLDRMEQVVEERAANAMVNDAPGSASGLLVSKPIFSHTGERADEWKFDAALVREYRATMEQAARELGQLTEKVEIKQETLIRQYVGVDVEDV